MRLGVSPITGTVHDIDHRCRLLEYKVVDFHRRKMLVYESQRCQQWRSDIAPRDAALLKQFAELHLTECIRNALIAKDMDRVCLMIEAGADPTSEICGGVFPIMAAVLRRSLPIIRRLLAAGADIDTCNSRGMTALMWAVKRDDYAMVEGLLESGASIGVEGCSGWTAMSIAARHGRIEIVQLLVETLRRDKVVGETNSNRALNHQSTSNGGLTPLSIAAIHRNEFMVRSLMRLGASPRVKCHRGDVAGEHAEKAGWSTLGMWLRETCAFGASGVYTFSDVQAEKALQIAAVRMIDAIMSGATAGDGHETPKRIESNARCPYTRGGTSQDALDSDDALGRKRLLYDASCMQVENLHAKTLHTVEVLREGHAAPDTETDIGHTALMSAAYRGLEKDVQMLLREGADPNYCNRNDRTALMAAAAAGHRSVVITLLMKGADAAVVDINGKSAGAYACEKGHCEVAELLAIATSHGCAMVLEWDKCRTSKKEEQQCESRESLNDAAGVNNVDRAEADMHDWMFCVTKPRETVTFAELKGATKNAVKLPLSRIPTSSSHNDIISASQAPKASDGGRCPKCTLLVPCLHFTSIESLTAEFPDGVPEWRWNRPRPDGRVRGSAQNKKQLDTDFGRVENSDRGIVWWKRLRQQHRFRAPQSPSGIGGLAKVALCANIA